MKFEIEGVDWILLPTFDINLELSHYKQVLNLHPEKRGQAKNDPFLDEYAILRPPNGIVIEIVKPKPEHANLFRQAIFSYTVANLLEKAEQVKSLGGELIGDVVDTNEGWGWFYTRNSSGILYQIQGPLPK